MDQEKLKKIFLFLIMSVCSVDLAYFLLINFLCQI
uniref:Uncharacterized protein n=1 Tax=Rhizophora mucronata TaxID=61149 RepID=A0A2P2PXD8_RHIMU